VRGPLGAWRLPLLLSDGRGVRQVQIFETILVGLSTIFSFIKPFSSNQEVVMIFLRRSIYDCDRKAAAVVVDLFGLISFLVTFCISLKKTSL
jgi:hypothetical protein